MTHAWIWIVGLYVLSCSGLWITRLWRTSLKWQRTGDYVIGTAALGVLLMTAYVAWTLPAQLMAAATDWGSYFSMWVIMLPVRLMLYMGTVLLVSNHLRLYGRCWLPEDDEYEVYGEAVNARLHYLLAPKW